MVSLVTPSPTRAELLTLLLFILIAQTLRRQHAMTNMSFIITWIIIGAGLILFWAEVFHLVK